MRGVRGVDQVGADERAAALSRRSVKKSSKLWALDLAIRCMDLTTLEGADTPGKVAAMCSKAVRPQPGDDSIRAKRDEVLAAIEDSHQLVDVRSPQEFSGELIAMPGYENEGAQRAGHIPGAKSIPWAQAVKEDGTFKSADELRELYGGKGVLSGDPIIAYCRIGERSAHTWFVLHELLGEQDVKNYDGSWTEWGNMVGLPIEKESGA